ncbi:MAG TPA: DinB family protein [Trichormus sp.]|jgi:uncharacterized damage-inducible protein DinB
MSLRSTVASDNNVDNGQLPPADPQLAPPGAGLPFIEWAIARYVLVPLRLSTVSLEEAVKEFAAESAEITALAKSLDETQLSTRRLIPRLRGLEDSSRYWSIAMTLQHMCIVNNRVRGVIIGLTHGKTSMQAGSTADVKPPTDVDCVTVLNEFEQTNRDFLDTVSRVDFDKFPRPTFAHPWFGELTARQWVQFLPVHQQVHKKQIAQIIRRL